VSFLAKHQKQLQSAARPTIRLIREQVRLNPIAACIRAACLPTGLALLTLPVNALAGPEGGVVTSGSGTITNPDTTTTVITQQTHNLWINWDTYNVNVNEAVQYLQPSSKANAFNKIFDQNPSQIFGTITANGNVILLNPNGIYFSPTASVNVNALTASALDITEQDAMNGNYTFTAVPDTDGVVVNQGVIQASTGGAVNLLGQAVSNEGLILANAGQVNLVAGNRVIMDFDGDGLMQFTVAEETLKNAQALNAAVNNSGEIVADGGAVLLKGSAASEVFTNVVNNDGIIRAGRIENEGGVIRLVGVGEGSSVLNTGQLNASAADSSSDGGTIEITAENITNTGTIKADSTGGNGGTITLESNDTTLISGNAVISATAIPSPSEGEGQDGGEIGQGGTIHVLGDKVGLLDLASIDVSGALGGGTVLIGGDFQGKNPDIQNASRTYIGSDASITADATDNGDGGKVIVWADEVAGFNGAIRARGGAEAGDGGFVEVSGKDTLLFRGTVDVSAPQGKFGTILLDPRDIIVANAGSSADDGQLTTTTPNQILFAEGTDQFATDFTISDTAVSALTGNVILQANRNIDIANNANITLTTLNQTLTLQAGNNITIGEDISTNGAITIEADSPHSNDGTAGGCALCTPANGVGSIITTGDANITTTSGSITLIAADFDFDVAGTATVIDAGAGNINVSRSRSADTLTLGTGVLSNAEINTLTTTGVLKLGQATTAGTTGVIGSGSTITANSLVLGNDITPGGATTVHLYSGAGGITGTAGGIIETNLAITTAGTVNITDADTNVTNLAIKSTGGNITFLDANAITIAEVDGVSGVDSDTGSVTLTATAGGITVNNTSADNDIEAATGITISLNSNDATFTINSGADVENLTSGGVIVNADEMVLTGTIHATDQTVTLRPRTGSTDAIRLGANPGTADILELDNTELNNVFATTLVIGSSTASAITIDVGANADITPANITNLRLINNAAVTATAGGVQVTNLAIESAGPVNFTDSTTDVSLLAANVTGTGNAFTFTNEANGFTVGSVDGLNGITTASGGTTSGGITLSATAGSITVNNNVVTGTATQADAAGDQQPASGTIQITAATDITGTGNITTGAASLTGAAAAATTTDSATSGNINLTATGGTIGISGTLTTGTAQRTDGGAGTDTTTSGSINLVSSGEINNGTAATPLNVLINDATGGSVNNAGKLNVTTTSAAGNVYIASTNKLALGTLNTLDASNQVLQFTVTGGNALTVADASDLDIDDLWLTADRMLINNNITADTVTLRNQSAGRAIDLGSTTDAASALELSDTELDRFTVSELRVGRNDANASGDITVSTSDINPANTSTLHLLTGGKVTATAFGIIETNLAIEAGDTVQFTAANTDVDNLAINTSNDDITFNDIDDLTITTVDGVTGVSGRNITLFADGGNAGNLTINEAITSGASGSVLLKADNTITFGTDGDVSSTGTTVTVHSDFDDTGAGAIVMNSGSSITSNDGDIILGGGSDPTSDSAVGEGTNTSGISLVTATLDAGAGDISLRGTGKSAAGGGGGLSINSSSLIQTTTGNINITGQGGDGTTGGFSGIGIDTDSDILTAGGTITLQGTGGTVGNSTDATGISIGPDVLIETDGSGDINITGIGGNTGAGSASSGGVLNIGTIRSTANGGNIIIMGTGGGGTGANGYDGVVIYSGASAGVVESLGAGNIEITGTGGSGASTFHSWGVRLAGDNTSAQKTRITSSGTGDITITGTGGNGVGQEGIYLENFGPVKIESTGSGSITLDGRGGSSYAGIFASNTVGGVDHLIGSSTMTGDLTLIASNANDVTDTIDIDTGVTLDGTGDLFLEPGDPANTVSIGGGTGVFALSAADLAAIDNGFASITIGSAAGTGAVTVAGAWTVPTSADLTLRNPGTGAGDIAINGTLTMGASKTLTLHTGGGVTDTAALVTDNLYVDAVGTVLLDFGASIGTVAADTVGSFSLLNETDGFTVGTVNSSLGIKSGITTANITDSAPVTTGSISLGAAGNITFDDAVTTGDAEATVAGDNATSGSISINVGSNYLSGLGSLNIGSATAIGGGSTAQTGDLSLTALEISGDATNGIASTVPLIVSLAEGTGGDFNIQGAFNATATGSGVNGEINVSSSGPLTIGTLNTTDADTTNVKVTVTGGETLIIRDASNLDQDKLVLTADVMQINNTISFDATKGTATLQNESNGVAINLGSVADTDLELSSTEVSNVGADLLIIGRNDGNASGAITVSADITPDTNTTKLHLKTNSTVTATNASGGGIIVTNLGVEAGDTVEITETSNSVTFLAINAPNETVTFTQSGTFGVAPVNTVNGITSGMLTLTSTTGDITVFNPGITATGDIEINVNGDEKTFSITAGSDVNTDTGGITVTADNMNLLGTITNTDATTANIVTLKPFSTDGIRLGSVASNPSILELSDAELDNIFATTLRIGSATAGAITFGATDISPANITNLHLINNSFVDSFDIDTAGGYRSIIVPNLAITSTGNVFLFGAANDVDKLAGNVTGAGGGFYYYFDTNGFDVNSVDGVAGIQTAADGNGLVELYTGVSTGDVTITNNIITGSSTVAGNTGYIYVDTGGGTGNIIVNGNLTTGDADAGSSGSVFLFATGANSNVAVNGNVTTGYSSTAAGPNAISGSISISAGNGVTIAGNVETGLADGGFGFNGTSGGISINADSDTDGDGNITGTGTLVIGDAGGGGAGTSATTGNLSLTAAEISGDAANGLASTTPLDVFIPVPSGATTLNQGLLNATATGSGVNGEINVVSSSGPLTVGVLDTTPADATNVTVTVTGGYLLTLAGSSNLDIDNVVFEADDMAITNASAVTAANSVTLQQNTAGDTIALGTVGDTLGNNVLELDNAEINSITATTLRIGRSDSSGGITFTNDISPAAGVNNVHLRGDFITGILGGLTGNKNMAITTDGAVNFTDTSTAVSNLAIDAGDSIVFTEADGFSVGTVDGVAGITGTTVGLTALGGNLTVTNTANANDIDASGAITISLNGDEALFTINGDADIETNTGGITVTADNMNLLGTITNTDATTANIVTLKPVSSDEIRLGATTTNVNVLELSDAELDKIFATTLRIGTTSGIITFGAADLVVSPVNITNLHLITTNYIENFDYDGFSGNRSIVVPNLALTAGSFGAFIYGTGNDVDIIAAETTSAGGLVWYRGDADGFTVGSVDGVTGVTTASGTTSGEVRLDTGGGAGTITVTENVTTGNASAGASGAITIATGTAGNIVINGDVTTGDSTTTTVNALTGLINISAGNGVSIDGGVTTGTASAQDDFDATSGAITINADNDAGGNGNISGGGTITIGDASTVFGAFIDTATTGNLNLTAAEIAGDPGAGVSMTPLDVDIPIPTGGDFNIQGQLNATATGSGNAGEINVTSSNPLTVGTLNTTDANTTNVKVTVTGGNLLTLAGSSNLDIDNVVFEADDMAITNASAVTAANSVTLQQNTASDTISLGAADILGNDVLELDNAEINSITATTLRIGRSDSSGGITFTSNITPAAGVNNVHLRGDTVTASSGGLLGNKNLAVSASGAVSFTNVNTAVSTLAIANAGNSIVFTEADGFSVGTVDGVAGITGTTVGLTALSGNLTVTDTTNDNDIDASGAITITLQGDEATFTIINSDANVETSSGGITVNADEMVLNGTITAPGQIVTLRPDNSADADDGVRLGANPGLADTLELDDAELDRITADVLRIGSASTSGAIIISSDISPSGITDLHLIAAAGGITGTAGGIILSGSANGLALESGGTINITDTSTDIDILAISAPGQIVSFFDLDGYTIGTVDGISGITAGALTLSNNNGIGLGGTPVTNGLNITDAQLNTIIASSLTLNTTGIIRVDGITGANSANANAITLNATGTAGGQGFIEFINNPSEFNDSLSANARQGMDVNVNLTSTTGSLSLEGDLFGEDNPGADDIAFTAGRILTAATTISLDATVGKITGAGSLTLNAAEGITINDSLTTAGILTINADTDADDNTGTLTVASGATVNSGGFALNITANDLDLVGNLNSGGAVTTINDSDGTGIGLGGTMVTDGLNISDAELGRITAASLTLNTVGNFFVNGITDGNSTNTNAITLNATGTLAGQGFITFSGVASVFNDSLIANAAQGMDVNVDLTSTTGALDLDGDANNADNSGVGGTDDIGFASGVVLTAGTGITLDATTGKLNGSGALTLTAASGVNINDNLTTNGTTIINNDNDGNGTGNFVLDTGVAVNTTSNMLAITANDVTLDGTLNSGANDTTITVSDGGSIGLGNGATAVGLRISGAELQRITANELTLSGTNSTITVDGVTGTNSNNVGTVVLDATNDNANIVFNTATATFNALTANADDGITVAQNITTDVGNLVLEGDFDNAMDTSDAIVFNGNRTLMSAGLIQLDATTGKIEGDGTLTLDAAEGITINDSLTTAGILTINADTDADDNTGTLTVASGATVNSGGFALNITANDLDLVGNLNSGGAVTTINDSDGTGIGLGGTMVTDGLNISDAELGRITAASLTLNTVGNFFVNGITDGNSTNTNAITLNATGTLAGQGFITFSGVASVFNDSLIANAAQGMDVNVDLTSTTGALDLDGDANNADNSGVGGTDDIGFASGVVLTAGTGITLDATTGKLNGSGALTLTAASGVNINDNLTTNGTTIINNDNDGNGTGNFVLDTGVAVNTTSNMLAITANDVTLDGTLNSGANDTTITVSDGGSIGLGNGATAVGLRISGAELQRITANELTLSGTNSTITVDGVTGTNSNNVGTVVLDATNDNANIVFNTATATFNALTANADDGITVAQNITTDVGNLVLEGDFDNAMDTSDAIVFNGNRTLMSAGLIQLDATTGKIEGDGTLTLDAVTGITINDDLHSDDELQMTTSDGPIDVTNAEITTDNAPITFTAGDAGANNGVILVGAGGINSNGAGNGDIILHAADGVSLGGDVDAGDDTVSIDADFGDADSSGAISWTNGTVTGSVVTLNAATGITAETSTPSLSADNTTSGNVDIENEAPADTTITSLTTAGGGSIFFDNINDFALVIDGNVTALGGTITINSDGGITIQPAAQIDAGLGTINISVDKNDNEVAAILNLGDGVLTGATAVNLFGSAGNDDTLIAQDLTNTWEIKDIPDLIAPGTSNQGTLSNGDINSGGTPANFIHFANITGGTDADTFTVTTGSLTGLLNGDRDDGIPTTGVDILSYLGGPTTTVVLTSAGSLDGFAGTATNLGTAPVTPAFDNINFIKANTGGGGDTITGLDTISTWDITAGVDGTNTYTDTDSTNTLDFSGFDNINGGSDDDTFNINTTPFTGNLYGNAGDDTFNINTTISNSTITGNDGNNNYNILASGNLAGTTTITNSATGLDSDTFTFTAGGQINGPVLINGNATWNPVTGVPLTTLPAGVTGAGNLQVPVAGAVTIGTSLVLPVLTGFTGHLVIGGSIDPFVSDMSNITPFDNSVNITATTLTVGSPITLGSGANLTLLATDTLNLNQDINIGSGPGGGELTLGVVNSSLGTGDIVIGGVGNRTITAGQGYFVATGGIQNTLNLILSFGGPSQILEAITVDPLGSFNPASAGQVGSVSEPTLQFINIINTLGASSFPVAPYDPNDPSPANVAAALATGLVNAITGAGGGFGSINIFNATAQLIALEELGFIDTGLFEEDLTLFGVIGYGIALALAQCEEIEGCAPNVTLEELNELIGQLEARITELDRRCAEGDEASCGLLERYKEELGKFLGYREELQKYLTASEEELEDEFTEEFGEEGPGETTIEVLARMLETVKARIAWLESLRAQPEARARLGESIGIELTLEVLEEIIQGAISEAQFIEKQIKLLLEGTQALADPVFTAEARDYTSIQHIGYGPAILNLGNRQNMKEWVY
jgi:filamentous hemagglutinin family protein